MQKKRRYFSIFAKSLGDSKLSNRQFSEMTMEPALDFIGIMIMLTHVLNSYCMPAVILNWDLFTKSCPTLL